MEIKETETIIEALLFASGDSLSVEKLVEITGIDKKTVKVVIDNMINTYANTDRGILIRQINNNYQMYSNPKYYEHVKKLFEPRQRQGLSNAAYETLAIIAYNEPITRASIEQIRGVNSDSALSKLVEKNLVQEAGKMDSPGKPILYKTTEEFLRAFGLKANSELPPLDMIKIEE